MLFVLKILKKSTQIMLKTYCKKEGDFTSILLYNLFDEYLVNYHYSNNSKYNISNDINQIKKFFVINKFIDEITESDIQEFINYQYYVCNLKDSTVFNRFRRLKAIFNYAVRKRYILFNPCVNVKVRKVYSVHK